MVRFTIDCTTSKLSMDYDVVYDSLTQNLSGL